MDVKLKEGLRGSDETEGAVIYEETYGAGVESSFHLEAWSAAEALD